MKVMMRACRLMVAPLMLVALLDPSANRAHAERTVSLDEALRLASMHSPLVSASQHEVQAAEAGQTVAKAAYLPKVEASETYTRTNNPSRVFGTLLNQGRFTAADFNTSKLNSPEALENFRSHISVVQPVYNGGRERIGVELADFGRSVSTEGLAHTRQRVFFHVTRAYYDLLLAKATLSVAQETVRIAEANASSIQARYQAGATVKADLLQADVRLASHREELIGAEQDVRVAGIALRHAIGLDEAVDVEEGPVGAPPQTPPLETAMGQALEARHDYRRLAMEVDRSQAAVDLAKSAYLPTFNLEASYELNNTAPFSENGSNNYVALGVVTINLFNGFGDQGRVQQARAEQEKIRQLLAAKRREIEVEVIEAYYGLSAALERLAVSAQSVEQAEENLRIMRNRYAGGISPVLDLLTAEFVLNQAKQRRLRAVYDGQVGRARLAFVTGQLGL